MNKGYKVVRYDEKSRTYWSAALRYLPLRYFKHKPIRPIDGDGPLGVFKTLEDAKKFCLKKICPNSIKLDIFECLYAPSKERNFWREFRHDDSKEITRSYIWATIPHGTDFADEVILGKKMK